MKQILNNILACILLLLWWILAIVIFSIAVCVTTIFFIGVFFVETFKRIKSLL